jgi:hypothetical protein
MNTTHNGIEYWSRLEARWAAFFDRIGWAHTYEPFDGDGYIPDFLIPGEAPMLVEVKPAVLRAEYLAPVEKATAGLVKRWQHDILIVGAMPFPVWPADSPDPQDYPHAGILGEHFDEPNGDWCTSPARPWGFDSGRWHRCRQCGRVAVHHEVLCFRSRPCGHYDGDGYLGKLRAGELARHWAAACNDVKWRAR